MPGFVKKCPFVRHKVDDDVRVLDYRHSSLQDVPTEVFNKERTLEELYADSNQIRDLPRELFYCHGLRKLSLSDNEITSIPPAISSLSNLEELDLSKNGIIDVPENIKGCKYLRSIDISVNPLGKLPEGITHLNNLTYLYLNDTFLDFLPGSFGRMVNLKILELRENHLKTLPHSFSRLVHLERLDIGNNEFTELSDVIGGLSNLLELWCDNNQITAVTNSIGNLKQLMFLDASSNQLQTLPVEIEGCVSLADLHLTSNSLIELPDSIGKLNNLTTLKVDDNHLVHLPTTLGGLSSLSELNVSANDLTELPASIGLLRNLRTFYADENMLCMMPAEIGSCSGITVLSIRGNKLTYIPDELGRIPRLRVLNLSDNLLNFLPFSIIKLKELQALWLSENQTRPLIPLQSEYDEAGRKILTCYLLPQGEMKKPDERVPVGESDSFHGSMWDEERHRRQQIHFDFAYGSDEEGRLVRCPTPYPKEMREKVRHARNLALRQMINVGDRERPHESVNVVNTLETGMAKALEKESGQKLFSYSQTSEHGDMRVREVRNTKPLSPRLQETHRLYKLDKEKLMKSKAHMQHRRSVPDFATDAKFSLKAVKREQEKGETGLSWFSGSVPDLTVDGKEVMDESKVMMTERSALPVYDDIYSKQIANRHRGRRSRRSMREYDSDTGYRSEGETLHCPHEVSNKPRRGTSSEIFSVQSQPLPYFNNFNHRYKTPREQGGREYASDINSYICRGSFPTANAAAAAFKRQNHVGHQPAQSLPFNLDTAAQSSSVTRSGLSRNFLSNSPLRYGQCNFRDRSKSDGNFSRLNFDLASQSVMNNISSNQFAESSSPNYPRPASNPNVPASTVSNDELYQHNPCSNRYQTSNLQKSNDNNTKALNVSSSSQSHSGTNLANFSSSSFHSPSNLGSSMIQTYDQHSSTQNSLALQPQTNFNQGFPKSFGLPPSKASRLNFQMERNVSPHYAQRTPSPSVLSKDISGYNQTLHQSPGLYDYHNSSALKDHRPNKLYTVPEQRSTSQQHLTGQTVNSEQPLATPPPYISTPPYRRPDNKSPAQLVNRLPSDSPTSNVDSPRSASNIPVAGTARFALPNVNINRSELSPCGFHGSKPFSDLPSTPREKLTFSDYSEIEDITQDHYLGKELDKSSSETYQCHSTSRSGSISSQIGSASQIGPQSRRHDPSNFSDSHSDSHNYSSSRGSPYSGYPTFQTAQLSSKQELVYDPISNPFGAKNLEDLTISPNQEQSSQVSSSTDSGYGHGHLVYDCIGDYSKVFVKGYPKRGSQGSHSSEVTSVTVSQRQMSGKSHDNVQARESSHIKDDALSVTDSIIQEHTDKFHVTIYKNPGLGFSIAGGIGSHGNPYKDNDIGIFVTKVMQDGPAAKLLRPGDKILHVNNMDFQAIDHQQAVAALKTDSIVDLLIERVQKVNLV